MNRLDISLANKYFLKPCLECIKIFLLKSSVIVWQVNDDWDIPWDFVKFYAATKRLEKNLTSEPISAFSFVIFITSNYELETGFSVCMILDPLVVTNDFVSEVCKQD